MSDRRSTSPAAISELDRERLPRGSDEFRERNRSGVDESTVRRAGPVPQGDTTPQIVRNAADHRCAGPAPGTAPAPNRTTRSAWNWSLPAARFTPKFQSMTVIEQPEIAEPGLARVSRQHLDWRVHQC